MPTAVEHVEGALARLTKDEIEAMTPARRARFIATLEHWWDTALKAQHRLNPNTSAPRSGVLARLKDGERTP